MVLIGNCFQLRLTNFTKEFYSIYFLRKQESLDLMFEYYLQSKIKMHLYTQFYYFLVTKLNCFPKIAAMPAANPPTVPVTSISIYGLPPKGNKIAIRLAKV